MAIAPSLKRLALQGTAWTVLGYGTGQVLRLLNNLILTRLLVPEYFGLMALITLILTALYLITDLGIEPNIVRHMRGDDPAFLNTAWTIQAGRGIIQFLGCLVLAWPAAAVYHEERLLWLLPIMGVTALLAGFNATSLFSLERHLKLGKLTLFDLSVQGLSLAVMIIWARLSPSILALVVGNLVGAVLRLAGSHLLLPGVRHCLAWDRAAVRELFSFGRWILVSTLLTFLAFQTDRLILGRLFSLQLLGIYTIAFTLADLPKQMMLQLNGRIIYPLISRHLHLKRSDLRAEILERRRWLVVGLALGLVLMITGGDSLVGLLYDQRYSAAAWMAPVLLIGLWPNLLTLSLDAALHAIGKPNYVAFASLVRFIYIVIGLPLGFTLLGVPGAVIAVALADLPYYAGLQWGLRREGLSGLRQDVVATALFLGLLAVALLLRAAAGSTPPLYHIFG